MSAFSEESSPGGASKSSAVPILNPVAIIANTYMKSLVEEFDFTKMQMEVIKRLPTSYEQKLGTLNPEWFNLSDEVGSHRSKICFASNDIEELKRRFIRLLTHIGGEGLTLSLIHI